MNYKFAIDDENFEDYSSGRVLYNQSGSTSFPVRLASEIFQQCTHFLKEQGKNSPYTIYDPCCGGAYLLTTLAFKHGNNINKIYASDIDDNIISLAQRNLSLTSFSGLNKRIEQINGMIALYSKTSHTEALMSAERFLDIIKRKNLDIGITCFNADITKFNDTKCIDSKIDIVITDLPYGDIVNWYDNKPSCEAIRMLLNNILPVLSEKSVVAVVSKKKVSVSHEKYKQIKKINIGKRQIVMLRPDN